MSITAGEATRLQIVDNGSKSNRVLEHLQRWISESGSFDIASGYFEIGALLALEGDWQKLEKLRVLMGDEITRRTKDALIAGVETAQRVLDSSLEHEKERTTSYKVCLLSSTP